MSSENIKQQVRSQLRIFAALLVLAIVSGVSSTLSDAPLIAVVMVIAAVQGTLILAYLMHVKGEVAFVQSLLSFSAFFLIVLFLVTLVGLSDPIEGTKSLGSAPPVSELEAGTEH